MIIHLVNSPKNIQKLLRADYPIYKIDTKYIDEIDGIVFDDAHRVVDDLNVKKDTVGKRRLLSPFKDSLSPLRKVSRNIRHFLKRGTGYYIDTSGRIIRYEKSKMTYIKYHKIRAIKQASNGAKIWVYGVNFPLNAPERPHELLNYVGVLYLNDRPWIFWDFSKTQIKPKKIKI